MRCFLDLDGVLVNFVGGACRFHRRRNPYALPASLGEWDCVSLLGMSQEEFWRGLDFHFWRNLEWMADGRRVLDLVEGTFGASNVCLLTSPPDNRGSVDGKRAWVNRHLPQYFRRLLIGSAKEFMAGPEAVLVDDYAVNVDRFAEAGGFSVLVPRPWNRRHAEETIQSVRNDLSLFGMESQHGKTSQAVAG